MYDKPKDFQVSKILFVCRKIILNVFLNWLEGTRSISCLHIGKYEK